MIIESNHLFTLERFDSISVNKKEFEDIVIVFVEKGHVIVDIDSNRFILNEGHAFILNPSNVSSIKQMKADKVNSIFFLYLNMYEVLQMLDKQFVSFSNLENHDNHEWYNIVKIMQSMIGTYSDNINRSYDKLMQNAFFCDLLEAMIPFLMEDNDLIFGDASPLLNTVLCYIQDNCSENISLTGISEKFYISDSTLSRWIKQYTGMNYEKYVRKLRVRNAALEISNTDKTMAEIAVKQGFSNPAAMNKAFHEFYNMTPGEYRKKHLPHWEKGTLYYT